MDVSDVASQVVAMQAQMARASFAMAAVKNAAEQQQAAASLLTEAVNAAAASADGRGALLDILV